MLGRIVTIGFAFGLLLTPSAVWGQSASAAPNANLPPPPFTTFVYSVKFLCGTQTQGANLFTPPSEPPVKPGNYATAVNIHNFHAKLNAIFQKKAVIALPQNPQNLRGPIGAFVPEALHPDEALEVDCTNIVALLPPTFLVPPFIKGFVEIRSPVELSVVAVYTSQTCLNPSPNNCSNLGELELEVERQSAFLD